MPDTNRVVDVKTGSIVAAAGTVFAEVQGAELALIQMVATALVGHNATFEVSLDSTDGANGEWRELAVNRSNVADTTVEATTGVLAATPVYFWRAKVKGVKYIRVRAAAHTSGTTAYRIVLVA